MKALKAILGLGSAILVACGGSGDGSVAGIDGGGAFPPVATSVTSVGRITGFGSVIVNGVRYDTSGAEFVINGTAGSQTDLAVGQVVVVQGTISDDGATGSADTVTFDDLVEGPIESIDLAEQTMIVLGQRIITNLDTVFEDDISPSGLEGLSVGNTVEISGFRNSNGDVVASYVDLEDSPDEFEVTGIAANVDTASMTFSIQDLVIDYSAAMVNDFPGGAPEDGQLVEAEGMNLGAQGELLATEIEFKGNDFSFDDDDDVEVEGLITRFVSDTDFDVSGIPVTTTSSTEFEDGSRADLALDRKVEVEGSVNAAGILVAEEIEFKREGVIRIGGLVEDVQADNLTVLGLQVFTNVGTEFDDDSDLDIESFDLGDVNVGDYVEIRAFDDSANSRLVATRLERDDDEDEVFLRGVVESVNDPEFAILGVTIRTNAGTEFEADDDSEISAGEFFGQALGRVVEADGVLSGGVIIADEVELED